MGSSNVLESVLRSVHARDPDQIDIHAGYYGYLPSLPAESPVESQTSHHLRCLHRVQSGHPDAPLLPRIEEDARLRLVSVREL